MEEVITETTDEMGPISVDHESFIEAKEEAERSETELVARLTGCEFTDEKGVPAPTRRNESFESENYFVFDARLKSGEYICVVVPEEAPVKDRVTEIWAGSDSVSDIGGKRVPVTHLSGDVYTVSTFDKGRLRFIPLPIIWHLYEKGLIETQNGDWRASNEASGVASLIAAGSIFSVLSLGIIFPVALFLTSVYLAWSFPSAALLSLLFSVYISVKLNHRIEQNTDLWPRHTID